MVRSSNCKIKSRLKIEQCLKEVVKIMKKMKKHQHLVSPSMPVLLLLVGTNYSNPGMNEVWLIWFGGGKGCFRHSKKLFYIKGIAVNQPPISYHFWVCWWTSFFENLRPLRLEVAEICWGCWKQPQAHKKCFHNKNLVF